MSRRTTCVICVPPLLSHSGLSRRPSENPSGKQMDMEMVHGLSCARPTVDHEAIPALTKAQLTGDLDGGVHDRGPCRGIFDVIGGPHVPLGYHEEMHRRLGVDIPDHHHIIIAIKDIRLPAPLHDPAEWALVVQRINSLPIPIGPLYQKGLDDT